MRLQRNNRIGQKLCAHPRCSVRIGLHFLMCLKHWSAVPKGARDRVWAALRAWQADPGNAERVIALEQAQAEAIRLVA